MAQLTWHNEIRRIKDLIPYVANPRQITEKQAKDLKKSLDKFGLADPLVINTDNTIIGGHQRKKILETLMGVAPDFEVDVRVPDRKLTIDESRELNVRLNKNVAGWDFDLLANNFDLDDLKEWGFEDSDLDLDLWLPEAPDDVEPQIDKAEELRVKWGVESGQLWKLGEHRLICGDCTDKAVVDKVMQGEKFRLCFTSPPYADQRTYEIGEFDWLALMNGCTKLLFEYCSDPSDIVVNLGMSYKDQKLNSYWEPWLDSCNNLGQFLYGWYVWDKGRGFPGDYHGRLATAHEFLFHFSIGHEQANKWVEKKESSFERNKYKKPTMQRAKDGNFQPLGSPDTIHQLTKIPDSVIRMPNETDTQNHPAVFPVEFPEFGIKTWGEEGAIIYEPFSGSGTTLVACERLGRKCRAVEISPAYVAVAIQRWVDVTGGVPELLQDTVNNSND